MPGDPHAPGPAHARREGRSCPACGARLLRWRTAPTGEPTLPADVLLLRCPRCGTAATAGPAPAFAALHDAGGYASRRPRGAGLAAPLHRRFDRQRLRLLRRGARGRDAGGHERLLDVGAGRGRFVAAAASAGWRAEGLEPSVRGVEAAREHYGVALTPVGIDEAEPGDAAFDAISAWHVLEHLDDPAAAARRMTGWLRPGGVLLVGVPNLASAQARLGGARWYHLDLPRHRVHLTPDGVRRLLAEAGLDVEAVHHVLLEHNGFGMWQSLVNRLTGTTSHLYLVLKRAERPRPLALGATLLLLPALPLALAAELVAGLARRGGTVAVRARRPA